MAARASHVLSSHISTVAASNRQVQIAYIPIHSNTFQCCPHRYTHRTLTDTKATDTKRSFQRAPVVEEDVVPGGEHHRRGASLHMLVTPQCVRDEGSPTAPLSEAV
jgi:hypothetical protein